MNMQEIGGRGGGLVCRGGIKINREAKKKKKRFFYTRTFCAVNWNELEQIWLIRKSQNKTL